MSKLTGICSWGWKTILGHAKDGRTEGAGQLKGERTQLVNKETKESTRGGGQRENKRIRGKRGRDRDRTGQSPYILEERALIPKFSGEN